MSWETEDATKLNYRQEGNSPYEDRSKDTKPPRVSTLRSESIILPPPDPAMKRLPEHLLPLILGPRSLHQEKTDRHALMHSASLLHRPILLMLFQSELLMRNLFIYFY